MQVSLHNIRIVADAQKPGLPFVALIMRVSSPIDLGGDSSYYTYAIMRTDQRFANAGGASVHALNEIEIRRMARDALVAMAGEG